MDRPSSATRPTSRQEDLQQRTRSWARLSASRRHGELLRPDSLHSIFFIGMLLRANGEPC
jgi:hypothetical protein